MRWFRGALAWEEQGKWGASPVPGLGEGADPGATCRDRKQGVGKMVSSPSDLLGGRFVSGKIP